MKEKNDIRRAIEREKKKQHYHYTRFVDCELRINALKYKLYGKEV